MSRRDEILERVVALETADPGSIEWTAASVAFTNHAPEDMRWLLARVDLLESEMRRQLGTSDARSVLAALEGEGI